MIALRFDSDKSPIPPLILIGKEGKSAQIADEAQSLPNGVTYGKSKNKGGEQQ